MTDLPPPPTGLTKSGFSGLVSGKALFLGAAVATAVAFLVWTATQGAAVYFHTIDELAGMGEQAYERRIRVNGEVVQDSITKTDNENQILFEIEQDGHILPVQFRGTPPDLFGYSTEDRYSDVIVEGRLLPSGVFDATNLIVKHGPEFEPREIPAQ